MSDLVFSLFFQYIVRRNLFYLFISFKIKRKLMSEVHDDMPISQCGQPTTSHATHANVELPVEPPTYSHHDEQYEESSILHSCESDPIIKVLDI